MLITRRAEQIVPVPFSELMDAESGRTRVRDVDTASDWYLRARALQVRIEPEELEDPARLEALAAAAGLSPEDARVRYRPIG